MKLKHFFFIITILLFTACSSSKQSVTNENSYQSTLNQTKLKGDKLRDAIVNEALKWKGVKYKSGGESRKGIDCSGLTMTVYNKVVGYKLPRNSAAQQKHLKSISKKKLKKGDLIFFSIKSKKVNHVGLYIGKNMWREMRNFSYGCKLMVLASEYYDEKEYIRSYDKFLKEVNR